MKAPFSSISQMRLKARDFDNDIYIGRQVRSHTNLGIIALLESRSTQPKRYAVITSNGSSVYFLSYAEAARYFTSL